MLNGNCQRAVQHVPEPSAQNYTRIHASVVALKATQFDRENNFTTHNHQPKGIDADRVDDEGHIDELRLRDLESDGAAEGQHRGMFAFGEVKMSFAKIKSKAIARKGLTTPRHTTRECSNSIRNCRPRY